MTIKIDTVKVAFFTTPMLPVDPEYIGIDKDTLESYLEEHPMPKDPSYDQSDLEIDLLDSSGMYTLPKELLPETEAYIETLLNELVC